MNLCSDGHEEVCYESNGCPVCGMEAEISALEDEVNDL